MLNFVQFSTSFLGVKWINHPRSLILLMTPNSGFGSPRGQCCHRNPNLLSRTVEQDRVTENGTGVPPPLRHLDNGLLCNGPSP
jgi:hypothetical protein